jgi:hypothetical protein
MKTCCIDPILWDKRRKKKKKKDRRMMNDDGGGERYNAPWLIA